MTAAARKINQSDNITLKPAARPSTLEVFIARTEARALLWHCLEFNLHEAVDVLQHAAERDGLVTLLGQDRVQQILRDAFHQFRGCS
jgi:hypothetical protein